MIKNSLSKVKELFLKRQVAYQQTFKKDGPFSNYVLKDLAKFCRAYETTVTKDERTTLILEGRREVWLRIQENLNLSLNEIYDLHHIKGKE